MRKNKHTTLSKTITSFAIPTLAALLPCACEFPSQGLCGTDTLGGPVCDDPRTSNDVTTAGDTTRGTSVGEQTSQDTTEGTSANETNATGSSPTSTTSGTPICSNGQIEADEECDNGPANQDNSSCTSTCKLATCGDGLVYSDVEQCDDGNSINLDGCTSDCVPPRLGVISAGGNHTCALREDGTVRCWGENKYGQLGYANTDNIGDNELPNTAGPVSLSGKATQIAAGGRHTCALLENGTVQCWGYGRYGQLGYGNINDIGDDETPDQAGVVSLSGNVLQITAGDLHTCALLEPGIVRCWGNAGFGRLGYGNLDNIGDDEVPSQSGAVSIGSPVLQVAAGGSHTCAILEGGNLRCWGLNTSGQLGYGNTITVGANNVPSQVGTVEVGGTVVQVATGAYHTCALLEQGTLRCWGLNTSGQLGYGNTNNIGDNELPNSAPAVNVDGSAIQIEAGGARNCALLDNKQLRCWGTNDYGQLGYGNTTTIGDNEVPASTNTVDVGGSITQVTAAGNHGCALLEQGQLRCWGLNTYGQLGYGNTNTIGDAIMEMPPPNVVYQ